MPDESYRRLGLPEAEIRRETLAALEKAGRTLAQVDLFELNEAFAAQACAGLPSLDALRANLKGVYQDADGASVVGGGAILKVGTSKFLDLEYGRTSADDADMGSHVFDITLGFERPRRPRGWHLCPTIGINYEVVDDVEFLGSTLEASLWSLLAGVSVSRTFGDAVEVALAPFASARAAYSRASISFGGFDESETQEYGLIQAGLGILFTPRLALRPWVLVPVGLGEPDTVIGATLTIGIPAR